MIEIELPDLMKARSALARVPAGTAFAIHQTVNDVAKSAKAEATSVIFERYMFDTQGPIQRAIKVIAKGENAVVRFSGPRFPVKLFSPTRTDEGVEIMEIRGRRSPVIKHVFGARMQYGFGIFTRQTAERGPVQSVTGLSIANMAREDTEILPRIESHVTEQLAKRMKFWVGEALAGKMSEYGWKSGGQTE